MTKDREIKQLIPQAEQDEITLDYEKWQAQQIKANLARMIWSNDGFYPVIFQNDRVVAKAVRQFK